MKKNRSSCSSCPSWRSPLREYRNIHGEIPAHLALPTVNGRQIARRGAFGLDVQLLAGEFKHLHCEFGRRRLDDDGACQSGYLQARVPQGRIPVEQEVDHGPRMIQVGLAARAGPLALQCGEAPGRERGDIFRGKGKCIEVDADDGEVLDGRRRLRDRDGGLQLENVGINRKARVRLKRVWSRDGLLRKIGGTHASNEN